MGTQNIGIPKGTRDFSPLEMVRRNYIFNIIKQIFELYGYQSIETPAMENLSTLLGKYGEEGDKLLFKVLNSGDFMKNLDNSATDSQIISTKICEKGLRYDLTVPFARYVVQHRNEISFPFKRYQIQPVWRADKPQRGRYREFYQCDVDVIGSDSLLNEAELIQIINDVFDKLRIKTTIKINNRKILAGIAEIAGVADRTTDITVAIDKLDKIGLENVNKELEEKGISKEAIERIQPIIVLSSTPPLTPPQMGRGINEDNKESIEKRLAFVKDFLKNSKTGLKGIEETEIIINYLKELNMSNNIELDLVLARGLNYYTGTIIEVKAKDVQIGSICGGGRYDDLTGIFGLPNVSGVGISFGADRIYDVLNELKLFPEETTSITKLLLINFGGESERYSLKVLRELRQSGVNAELYPSSEDKMKKQMQYANNKNIPYVVMAGENEMKEGKVTLKNMKTGEQSLIRLEDLKI